MKWVFPRLLLKASLPTEQSNRGEIWPRAFFTCLPLSQHRHGDTVYVCTAGRILGRKAEPGWTRAGNLAGISPFLCRRSVNRVLICPSEVSHRPCYWQPLWEKKNHKPQQLLLGMFVKSIHFGQSYRGYGFLSEHSLPWRPESPHRRTDGVSLGGCSRCVRTCHVVLPVCYPPDTSYICFIDLGEKSLIIWKGSPF